jgi:small subunit ribosomal protein S20
MAEQKKEEKKAVKVPTPLKRHKQDAKKNLANRIWKSKIHTARSNFALAKDETEKKSLLNNLYCLLDKAAKNGLFKKNKVSRLKSRLAAK